MTTCSWTNFECVACALHKPHVLATHLALDWMLTPDQLLFCMIKVCIASMLECAGACVCIYVYVCVYVLRIVSTHKMLCFIYTLIIIIYSLLLRSKFALDRWNGVLYNGSDLWKQGWTEQGWTVSPHCCQGEFGMYMSKTNEKTEDIWIQESAILLDLSDDLCKLAQSVLSTHWYRKCSKVCDVS